jgi:SAM-dependent methyltransferase
VQMLDVVAPELMFNQYLHASHSTPDASQHAGEFVKTFMAGGHIQKGALVIDIGSGNGELLRAFKNAGMKVIGIDPSSHSASQSIIDGVTVYGELFTPSLANRISKEHGLASLVTAEFTLGSIDNLHAVAAGVRHILKPEGLFHFSEPYLADVVSQNLFDLVQHERISFFSVLPMGPFFKTVHMHLIDARRSSYRGGTISFTVQRSDGPHVVSSDLQAIIDEEKKGKLQSVETLQAFAARAESIKSEINTILTELKTRGKRVAGYGASGRTVSMIHEFGWSTDTIEFVADDNTVKQGLFIAGTTIPVVSPKAIHDMKPDVIFIFAYNHRDEIMRNLAGFHRDGGKFIIPFPKPSVI